MKRFKLVALLLAALMMSLTLTGCIGNFYENAGTIDGTTISSGLYLVAQYNAYSEASTKANEDLEEDAEEVSPLKATIEGQKGKAWIQGRTEELLRKYVAVIKLSREAGISLSSEGQSNAEQLMQYWPYMEELYTENGISQATMQRWANNEQLASELFLAMYAEGGEQAVPDEDLMAEYAAEYAHVRFLSVAVTSQEDSVDMSADIEPMVEEMVKALNGGTKTLEDVALQDVPAVYEMLGRDYDAESASENISTSYIDYYPDNFDTYSEDFLESLKGQNTGDYGSYNMGSTILIYEKIDTFTEDEDFESRRDTIIQSLKQGEFDEYLASIYNGYEVNWQFGARGYLSPSKIAD